MDDTYSFSPILPKLPIAIPSFVPSISDLFLQGSSSVPFKIKIHQAVLQFSSVAQLCPTLCNPMNCSTPGLPVHHQLPEFTLAHVHQVDDAIQPSHPLSSPSPPAPNPSQHHSLFQWVNSLHEVAKVLKFQLQHHSFQKNPRADLLQNGNVIQKILYLHNMNTLRKLLPVFRKRLVCRKSQEA